LSIMGLRNSRLTSHSFRIGRATTFTIEGLSDNEIKRLGRLESNAYLRYTFVFASQFKYICVFQKGGVVVASSCKHLGKCPIAI
jgi:hypothetical protein